ncbi:MAG: hypothetical protein AAFX94_15630, partial [Myxococcota bacterium]
AARFEAGSSYVQSSDQDVLRDFAATQKTCSTRSVEFILFDPDCQAIASMGRTENTWIEGDNS